MNKFEDNTIISRLQMMQGWKYIKGFIVKDFVFSNFKEALSIMLRIGFEAESMNHHPEWTNIYNKLNIRLRTHDADGITEKDFELANKIDAIIKTKIKE